ncbi:hypothetical protein N7475_008294 [Penicillium sp. IBT 31633x]|nr:hypothetical protein N7475_008294 [Penicillium sp. IBT 31633x]
MAEENMRGNPNSNSNSNPNPQTQSSNKPSASNPASNNTHQASSPTPPSLASRIQSSAAGLARSAFQPGSSDTAQILSNSTSSKPAAPSSSLSSTQLQTAREISAPVHSTPHAGPVSGAQSFRDPDVSTQSGIALPALTEEEFQQGNAFETANNASLLHTTTTTTTSQTNQIYPDDLQTTTGPWKGKARAHDPSQLQFETVWQRRGHDVPKNATTQPVLESTDGAAVVSLLSDTSFDPNFEDPTAVADTELDIAAAPAPLSASERETLDSFRKGMGLDGRGEESGLQATRLTPASLVPDIDTFLAQDGLGAGEIPATGANSLRDAVLARLPGASDWIGVQERYHDEVWGFLQPVLEAARVEIEEKEQRQEGIGAGEDGPAVRRLKMVLMHMKG